MKQRKQKFMLVLPLLVIPFLTLAFWALGGGKGANVNAASTNTIAGLNLELPGAHLKDDNAVDKLGYYEQAEHDSSKLNEMIKKDPYYNSNEMSFNSEADEVAEEEGLKTSPYKKQTDQNEAKIYAKINQLNAALNDQQSPQKKYTDIRPTANMQTKDVDRLEQMMTMMGKGEDQGDPELNQLNGMLDKIMDIQNPDRIKMKEPVDIPGAEKPLPVQTSYSSDTLVKGFYGLDNTTIEKNVASKTIAAVIHGNQVLVNGAVIKIRLLQDIFISDNKIPAGNFIYGTVSLNNERLNITITSIRCGTSIFNIQLEVYDMDGLKGIYIPGAITKQAIKQSADNSMQSLNIGSLDPSITGQVTAAGISTAKDLLSKKTKLVKVTVKANYQILLQNKN